MELFEYIQMRKNHFSAMNIYTMYRYRELPAIYQIWVTFQIDRG